MTGLSHPRGRQPVARLSSSALRAASPSLRDRVTVASGSYLTVVDRARTPRAAGRPHPATGARLADGETRTVFGAAASRMGRLPAAGLVGRRQHRPARAHRPPGQPRRSDVERRQPSRAAGEIGEMPRPERQRRSADVEHGRRPRSWSCRGPARLPRAPQASAPPGPARWSGGDAPHRRAGDDGQRELADRASAARSSQVKLQLAAVGATQPEIEPHHDPGLGDAIVGHLRHVALAGKSVRGGGILPRRSWSRAVAVTVSSTTRRPPGGC